MREKEIERFNDNVAHQQKMYSYFHEISKEYNSPWIRDQILKSYHALKTRGKYFADGNNVAQNFYAEIIEEMNLNKLGNKSIKTRYAMTVNYTNQKIIPTELSLLKKRTQIHFDRNQNSALDIATPLAILHSSKDGLWHYGIGPTSSGWVRDSDIAFGEREEIVNYLASKNFLITTSAKTALMIEGKYHDYMRMGVKLPSLMSMGEESMVMIPQRDEEGKLLFSNGTVKSTDTHRGYLPYTPKNILIQAFKFLNAPYGWGGMYGEQDCSKFLQEIYATTGMVIPRNSASQSNVGEAKVELSGLGSKAKNRIFKNHGLAGVSILHLSGHIVLYLGDYKGEHYIIHTVWGASSKHFALGRTAVTSLNFNNYFKKIDRLTNLELN
jgi:cell wall-associated NlpC family hydrolase